MSRGGAPSHLPALYGPPLESPLPAGAWCKARLVGCGGWGGAQGGPRRGAARGAALRPTAGPLAWAPRPACALPWAIRHGHPLLQVAPAKLSRLPLGFRNQGRRDSVDPAQGSRVRAPRRLRLKPSCPHRAAAGPRFLDLSGAGQAPGKREGRARTAAGSGGLSTERRSACPLTPSYLSSLIISGGRLSWSRGGGGGAVAEGAQPSPHGPAMFFPEPPAQPWSQQRTAFAGPVLLQGGPELSPGPPRPGAWSLTQA